MGCPPGSQQGQALSGAPGSRWTPQTREASISASIKTGSKDCGCLSLSATLSVLHPRELTQGHPPPTAQLQEIHLPAVCPTRGLPSWDLAAAAGTQVPRDGARRTPRITATPTDLLPIIHRSCQPLGSCAQRTAGWC